MSSSDYYSRLARDACKFVLSTHGIQGANWDQHRRVLSLEKCHFSSGGNLSCGSLANDLDYSLYLDRDAKISDTERVDRAIKRKVGNCEEFSRVAFAYLKQQGVKPIHRIALREPGDHVFVVIGKFDKDSFSYYHHDDNPLQWGPSSVVCDPWAEGMMDDKRYGVYPTYLANKYLREVLSMIEIPGFYVKDAWLGTKVPNR
jgi:hypothetical protein